MSAVPPPSPDADYTLVDEVTASAETQPEGMHVVDHEVQRILSLGWQRYVAAIRERVEGPIPPPVVKQITTSFEAECSADDPLRRGVRAISRTRRSYVLEEALWKANSGQVVATSRVIMTGIDRESGRAAEIPDAMWAAVEAMEGRTIPVSERPSP